jgi:hypothetical protein
VFDSLITNKIQTRKKRKERNILIEVLLLFLNVFMNIDDDRVDYI